MKQKLKTFLVWGVLVGAIVLLFSWKNVEQPYRYEEFARFQQDVEQGHVAGVQINSDYLLVTLSSGEQYSTVGRMQNSLMMRLTARGVPIRHGQASSSQPPSHLKTLLVYVGVLVLLIWAVIAFAKRSGPNANVLSLRKSRARLVSEPSQTTFADVGGCAEAKTQLGDVISFLKHPEPWIAAGARIPRGILLEGPPGCGKTLLARAVAGETKAKFFVVSGSEFVEMFVGVGAARVRDMFETAAKQAPAVIFIDEFDAVGRRRGSGIGSGHDEREQTLNQLLVCLDGFQKNDRVVVIGATNRPDILDKALLRPGRFDRRIRIPEMSRQARLQTLQIHTRQKPLADSVSLESLADRTEGFNGAQLENLTNEAAILAVRELNGSAGTQPVRIGVQHFAAAFEAVRARPEQFTRLDAVLIESTTQLAEPTGKAIVRLTLQEDAVVEGAIVWMDSAFIKIRTEGGAETIVPKQQIQKIESLRGTEPAGRNDLMVDCWSGRKPELA